MCTKKLIKTIDTEHTLTRLSPLQIPTLLLWRNLGQPALMTYIPSPCDEICHVYNRITIIGLLPNIARKFKPMLGLMLDNRLRRRPNMEPALVQRQPVCWDLQ